MNMQGEKNKHPVKPSILPQRESHFSWLRTRMSTERTLMSWVRTGTALIGFGFTIFQFFERFNQMEGVKSPVSPMTSRVVSLSMIGVGAVALIIAISDYRNIVSYLWSEEFSDIAGIYVQPRATPVLVVALMLALIGIGTFVTLLLRAVST